MAKQNERLHTEKNINSSYQFTPKAKMDAFRKLNMVLNELVRTASNPQVIPELRAEFKNRNFTGDNPFKVSIIKTRYQEAKPKTNASSQKHSVVGKGADQYIKECRYWVEPTCSGKYRSGHGNEVNADDVKIFVHNLRKGTKPEYPTPRLKKQSRLVGSRTPRKYVPPKKK